MKTVVCIPTCAKDLHLAVSTAQSLKLHEPDTKIYFSYEETERNKQLENYGKVFYGGERGWIDSGKRYIRHMNEIVQDTSIDAVLKIDADGFCLKPGGIKAIEENITDCPVIGSTLILPNQIRLSLGGIVAMQRDFIKELYKEPFYRGEDYTRSNLLKKMGIMARSVKEIRCTYRTENFSIMYACLVHPWVIRRRQETKKPV